MNRFIAFISKANQVLLFFGLLALGVLIGVNAYTYHASHYEPPHVQIAEPSASHKSPVITDVRFLGEEAGIDVFAVISESVEAERSPDQRMFEGAMVKGMQSGGVYDRGQMVNVNFVRNGRKIRSLLGHDAFVISNNFYARRLLGVKCLCYLFVCATEDTNNDHVLDARDRNDLYIVTPDLTKPDLIIKGQIDYTVISESRIVVTTKTKDDVRFFDVDLSTLTKREIQWK